MEVSGGRERRLTVLGGEQTADGRHVLTERGQVTWDDEFDESESTNDDANDDQEPLHCALTSLIVGKDDVTLDQTHLDERSSHFTMNNVMHALLGMLVRGWHCLVFHRHLMRANGESGGQRVVEHLVHLEPEPHSERARLHLMP